MMAPPEFPEPPDDAYQRTLVSRVRPSDWTNPTASGRYNLVVIGGGTAGLVTAAGAAGLGAKVALIERHWLGGDCLNTGCVPSKTLLRSAHAAADVRRAGPLGIRVPPGAAADFPAVMERVRRLRSELATHDSAARFRDLGVDVFLGAAEFLDRRTVGVAGQRLAFHRAVIATGARAAVPTVPGLAAAGYFTNETIFNLTTLPRRLAVIGGGPIGCELAQAFARLGSEVTILNAGARLLERDDPEASRIVELTLQADGVRVCSNSRLQAAGRDGQTRRLNYSTTAGPESLDVDAILVATGRVPNIDGLGLAAAGVAADPRDGVRVDDFLRTTNPAVYACGDVCLAWKFTHAADFSARLVIQNALFSLGPFGRRRFGDLRIPRCTYTDPEVAQVGHAPHDAAAAGRRFTTFTQAFADVDRARTEGTAEGLVKIHVEPGTDRIVGATIVGPHAGDLISEISVAMAAGMGLGRLAQVIHPYPTLAEAIRKCGDQYQRTRFTPGVKAWFGRWLRWRRR